MSNLIPGEIIPEEGEIVLNLSKQVKTVTVSNSGDRPCLLYTSPSPRDATLSRMPSSA